MVVYCCYSGLMVNSVLIGVILVGMSICASVDKQFSLYKMCGLGNI